MSPHTSKFAQSVGESTIVGMRRHADALAKSGVDIIDFGAGEPDFDVPAAIKDAAIQAIQDDHSHYIDPRGLAELRNLIARAESNQQERVIDPDQVIVTPGTLGALSLVSRAVLNPGDEVLVIGPRWGPYRNLVLLTGAVPVDVPMSAVEGRFLLDVDRLAAAVTPQSRAIIVNTPWNPTGRVLSLSELTALSEMAKQHDLWIVADEVYSEMVFTGARHVSIASLGRDIAERTVISMPRLLPLPMAHLSSRKCVRSTNDDATLSQQVLTASMASFVRFRREPFMRSRVFRSIGATAKTSLILFCRKQVSLLRLVQPTVSAAAITCVYPSPVRWLQLMKVYRGCRAYCLDITKRTSKGKQS
jgi:hypothetical protein